MFTNKPKLTIKKICRFCGNEFPVKYPKNPNVLCSLVCKYKETAQRQSKKFKTKNPIHSPAVIKKMVAVRRANGSYVSGKKHPQYKNGYWFERGYKIIVVSGKRISEHRHIMEQHLGRKLTTNEVVHHINENKLDNRLENLQLMTRAQHMKHHKIGHKYNDQPL
jgi:hypothetical protein